MPTFGVDLWDGFAAVSSRTDEGLTSLKDQLNFFKNLAKIEADYGKSLQKLGEKQQKDSFQKKGRVEQGSNRDSWQTILTEYSNIGGQHLELANDISVQLVDRLQATLKEKEKSRKTYLNDGNKLTKELENGYAALNKVKNEYQKQCKAAESAQTLHEKAEQDPTLNVAAVEKLHSKSKKAANGAQAADEKYQKALEQTNRIQSDFYSTLFPKVLDDLQNLETERIEFIKEIQCVFAKRVEDLIPSLQTHAESMVAVTEAIDPMEDVQLFINETISGKAPPADEPYDPDPFICANGGGGGGGGATGGSLSSMSPDQLQKEMDKLKQEVSAQEKTKAGIETLVACYGDGTEAKKQVEQQIRDCDDACAKCGARIAEIEGLLGVEASGCGLVGGGGGGAPVASAPVEQAAVEPVAGGVMDGFQAFSLYAYEAQGEGELSFQPEEYFWITGEDDQGWWTALNQTTNEQGLVPSNYLQAVE